MPWTPSPYSPMENHHPGRASQAEPGRDVGKPAPLEEEVQTPGSFTEVVTALQSKGKDRVLRGNCIGRVEEKMDRV